MSAPAPAPAPSPSAFLAPPVPADVDTAPGVPAGPATMSPAEFMAAAPARTNGSSTWANRYADELRAIVLEHANGSARNVQRHLGPSEIGHLCDRQVAGKLAELPPTNNVTDPWPSIMGTAGHTWMEDCLSAVNGKIGRPRFLTEYRVTPTMGFEGHPGTGDGYDADHEAVIDHKFLGDTSMAKVRKSGPPRHYFVQFLLYTLGFLALGLPVRRIALLAWPRTGSSLDGLYVWDHEITDADWEFLRDVVEPELRYRKAWAAALVTGQAQLNDVPANAADECHFCPFYRPQTARDGGYGCPGSTAGPAAA
ncbi:hypothetical protein [Pseudonocardia sp. McavD-2-B]|uniref:hypothetical protein n=1 Tax=Pseudonocardia sp. McavD-2-B TaxID=2954499 RepID=UPI002097A869|nr:hypothetical protein [Pseudonocardia sp. McavD-2-B]MCO7192307.1 hypothetical protein [Pseudonocardia sp. McavD-2-B]